MFVPAWDGQVCSLGYALAVQIEDDLGLDLTREQVERLVKLYQVDPIDGMRMVRRAALRRPKGAGKSPEGGYIGYAELVLPVRFDRWSKRGQPIGAPVSPANGPKTGPWVQFAAVSEDQTDNVMVWLYEILADREDTRARHGIDLGRTRIYLHNRPGRIETVTAAAGSREGQPLTCAIMDQTEAWKARNGGLALAGVIRRNIGKNNGWSYELQNAPEPGDGSVADATARAAEKGSAGVLFDNREPPEVADLSDRPALLDALRFAYGESARWVNLERLADEIQDPDTDPSDARRYYLNQAVRQSARAFDRQRWAELVKPEWRPDRKSLVVLGVDGARFDDAIAVVATDVETFHQWPVVIVEKPKWADETYEHDFDVVDGAVSEAFEEFDVWRVYVDPQRIELLMDKWQGRWGDKRVLPWYTNRPRMIGIAVKKFRSSIAGGDLTHDGDLVFARHIANSYRDPVNAKDDEGKPLFTLKKDRPGSPDKIDAAMAAILSAEARGDAIAAGALRRERTFVPKRIR